MNPVLKTSLGMLTLLAANIIFAIAVANIARMAGWI